MRKKPRCSECRRPFEPDVRARAHQQWYWHEDSESLCHGLMQAIMKRGLPRRQDERQRRGHEGRGDPQTGEAPLQRFLNGPTVGRPSPDLEVLQRAFRVERTRTQRRSDGTISVGGEAMTRSGPPHSPGGRAAEGDAIMRSHSGSEKV